MNETRKLPPQSIESEMSILGGIFLENAAMDRVLEIISSEDFYRENHRKIFNGMLGLYDRNEPIDLITTSTELKKKGELEEIGGGGYLATLVDYVPTAANIAYYCKIVRENADKRNLLSAITEMQTQLYEENTSADEVLNKLDSLIKTDETKSTGLSSCKEILRDAIKIIETRYEKQDGMIGIPYGIEAIDAVTCGMQRGDLIVIAGRPSMGKTTLALNIAENVSNINEMCALFTLEMSKTNLMDKMISSVGEINYSDIRRGLFRDNDWNKISQTAGKISEWKLFIDDTPSISLRKIRAKARQLKKKGLSVLIVDYIQLMALPGKENRTQELGAVSRGLKGLARELDIVVLALSQLNRSVDARNDKRPLMSDLRDSGEIEQDADVILFPFRSTVYCPACRDKICDDKHDFREHEQDAELIIEKQRNGLKNISVKLSWFGIYQKFTGYTEYERSNPVHWTEKEKCPY